MYNKFSTLIPSKESIEQGFKELIGLLSEAKSDLENNKGQNEQMIELM